ncbi:MAG: hypothetical protein WBV74_00410 [Pseudonocardiaceae bacterium]
MVSKQQDFQLVAHPHAAFSGLSGGLRPLRDPATADTDEDEEG